ncbi:MAG TPA: HIT family protein [Bryobacteraceae bacterium]|nr:HIT family protein [Bryobacteraceae bacterium]
MTCVFCDIVSGAVPAEIVWRGAGALAFLDNRPLFPGHVLFIPEAHVLTLADLSPDIVGPYFQTVQKLQRAVESAMEAEGSFVAINNRVSQSVPHLHTHIVPRRKGDGLKGFFWPRRHYDSDAHMREVADRIRQKLMKT